VRSHDLDAHLADLFQRGLALTRQEEDALWNRFRTTSLGEPQAWAAFCRVMTRLPELLDLATRPAVTRTLRHALGIEVGPAGARLGFTGMSHIRA
jgi:hypothetical protein